MCTTLRAEVLKCQPDLVERLRATVAVDEWQGPRTAVFEISDGCIRAVFVDDQSFLGVGVGPVGDDFYAHVGILALFMGLKSPVDVSGGKRFGWDDDLPRAQLLRRGIDFVLESWEGMHDLFGPSQWRRTKEDLLEFIRRRAAGAE